MATITSFNVQIKKVILIKQQKNTFTHNKYIVGPFRSSYKWVQQKIINLNQSRDTSRGLEVNKEWMETVPSNFLLFAIVNLCHTQTLKYSCVYKIQDHRGKMPMFKCTIYL